VQNLQKRAQETQATFNQKQKVTFNAVPGGAPKSRA